MRRTANLSQIGMDRSLLMGVIVLAALATSMALFFSLGARPAAAQEEASGDVNIEAITVPDKLAVIARSPSAINFGSVKVGDSTLASVTVTGTENGCNTIFLGACFGEFGGGIGDPPTLSGPNAGNFTIVGNNCKDMTLWAGSSCQITLRFSPNNVQNFNATLTIPPHPNGATTFNGGNTVALSGTGDADITKPSVTSFSPTGKRVSPGANATVTFSEDMNKASVEAAGTFTLTKSGSSTLVPAVVTYDPATKKATLNPDSKLKKGATYTAKATTAAKDLAGNTLDQEKTWTFKVRK